VQRPNIKQIIATDLDILKHLAELVERHNKVKRDSFKPYNLRLDTVEHYCQQLELLHSIFVRFNDGDACQRFNDHALFYGCGGLLPMLV
jgi:hypothetical protein